jgi:hypothetical protein
MKLSRLLDTSSWSVVPALAAVALPASQGLYDLLPGDTNLADMAPISATVFAHPDGRLRVWFGSAEAGSFDRLSPDPRVAAVAYAFHRQHHPRSVTA